MTRRGTGRGAWAAAAMLAAAPAVSSACELVLADHRSGRELRRLPLDPREPVLQVAFTHSVLGTPVSDRYRWRATPSGWVAELVEERFQGWGYGLPSAAGPGETLRRDGDAWVLALARTVDPLVIRALPELRMRVSVDGRGELALASLGASSVQLSVAACPP